MRYNIYQVDISFYFYIQFILHTYPIFGSMATFYFHTLTSFLTALVPSLATRVTVRLDPDRTTSSVRIETSPSWSKDYFTKIYTQLKNPTNLVHFVKSQPIQSDKPSQLLVSPGILHKHTKWEVHQFISINTLNSLFNGKVVVFNPDTWVQVPSAFAVRVTWHII